MQDAESCKAGSGECVSVNDTVVRICTLFRLTFTGLGRHDWNPMGSVGPAAAVGTTVSDGTINVTGKTFLRACLCS